ncbi:hypothetical protein ABL841_20415 [Variovorax paradoxus]|uniref:hypothetical protein n=1 Tax=Variovorax paradoxus TaxID=34073 RepID=UPI0003828014|nr:hypothetical protein [Variovorax paradoxus]
MRVKMRPRYRGGTRLSTREFVDQPWLCGMLTLQIIEGRKQLGLWEARPGDLAPPLGILWRPEVVACAFDTISFAGTEQIGGRWCYQVWYCETRSRPSALSLELLQAASTMNHEPN